MHLLLCALALGAIPHTEATGSLPEPALLPSGLELLYSDRVFFKPWGEPVVTIGVRQGIREASLRAPGGMVVDFYEAGQFKRMTVPPAQSVRVQLRRATAAAREHYVDLEGFPFAQTSDVERALALWRQRGLEAVTVVEEGTVLGIGGYTLDNREYRVVLPVASAKAAERVVTDVYRRFGTQASAAARLRDLPWGELAVLPQSGTAALATSYVRFTALDDGRIRVLGGGDVEYDGEIYVAVDAAERMAVVNVLGAERVLEGVVPSEIFPSAPSAALRAQAVAARNILLAQLGRRHHDDPFHLCSEQHCQVYQGTTAAQPTTSAAVHATAGQALFFGGHLVDAVYSSSCGGHTENNEAVWGRNPNPALRGRPDFDAALGADNDRFADGVDAHELADWYSHAPATYCSRASVTQRGKFRWQRVFSAAELNTHVAQAHPALGVVTDLRVERRGRGGRIVGLTFIGAGGEATVLHELPIRRLLGQLNSGAFVFDVTRNAKGELQSLVLRGGGWGHGVGMCQMGAIGRAEAGQSYEAILAHYYNGAEVVSLYQLPEPLADQR